MQWHIRGLLSVLAIGVCGGVLAAPPGDPSITAQGFAMESTRSAAAGQFEPVRVRVEAPGRIAKLLISQDTFEVDLATTPDRSSFALFGLDQRPLNAFDITLDFSPYLNAQFAEPGSYRIGIIVIDRDGGRSQAHLSVAVVGEELEEVDDVAQPANVEASPALQETAAVLRREGPGEVDSEGIRGLAWVTIEPVDVTIRLRATRANATLFTPGALSWGAVANRDQLASLLADARSVEFVDIPTARDQATGTVIALSGDGQVILIRVSGSTTAVSSAGTTVTLTASVRR
jgi:hypothetical protein